MKTLRMILEDTLNGEKYVAQISIEIPESGKIEVFLESGYRKLKRDLEKLQLKTTLK